MSEHQRLTVNITGRTSRALTETAFLIQESQTAVVGKAIQLYAYLRKIQEDGGSLYVRKLDGEPIECIRLM